MYHDSRPDVLVAGGGPAGVCAAIAAARAGARVLLVERNALVGGCAIIGLALHTFHTRQGHQIVRGLPWEIVRRLMALDGSTGPVEIRGAHMRTTTPIDHELMKGLLVHMLDEAGVDVWLHASVVGALVEGGRLLGVELATKSGLRRVRAHCFVDATGDGDLAALAGAPFEKGRPGDGRMQPASLVFKVARLDLDKVVAACGTGWATAVEPGTETPIIPWFGANLRPWNALLADRPAPLRPDFPFWGNTVRAGSANINATRLLDVDGSDADSLSRAELEGRRQVEVVFGFLKQHVPGFEGPYVESSAPFVGIRETRRILGDYVVNADDVRAGRRFDDAIGHGAYPIDIHHAEGTGVTFDPVGGDGDYDIPYRCLIPRRPEGLLVAGRCISCSHEAHGSLRVMIPSMVTGQAAGAAAALCSQGNLSPRGLDVQRLQAELRRQEVDLDTVI
jgi:hypothetical protein